MGWRLIYATPFVFLAGLVGAPSLESAPPTKAAPRVDFDREVRPILADNCFKCHGPDEKERKADLRLDTKEGLVGGHAITAGSAAKSELSARLTSTDPAEQMPPPKSGKKLTAQQIATIQVWIDQGAQWSAHWAFVPPTRPLAPALSNSKITIRNPIDAFVIAKLQAAGLKPSPPADRTTLIRRVTLDLTGLPPTPKEVQVFLKDESPDAYEKVVDRLLASPRYGERMAWPWLEAARYADTNGYQTDAGRDMWRWRDWVIEAYNRNLPYDRFTIEQIAGDLLRNPTLDQRIATGFNRNHRGNAEGGIIPEEYAVEYVADRVETTMTVWLGLTAGCARCHDHKFDLISQKDFYRLFAFFNNVPEKGRAVKFGNSPPFIKAPTREMSRKLADLDEKVRQAEIRFRELGPAINEAQRAWEKLVDAAALPAWSPERGLIGRFGKSDLDGTRFVDGGDTGDFGFLDKFTLAARIEPRKLDGAIVSRMPEELEADGYSVHLVKGKIQVHLTKRWLDDALRVETEEAIGVGERRHIAVSYDGSRMAEGVKDYLDGKPAKLRVLLDELNQSFQNKEPFRIGSGGGPASRFDGTIDDVRVYSRVLDAEETEILAVAAPPGEILRSPVAKRSPADRAKLRAFFLESAAPKRHRAAAATLRKLRDERRRFWESIPTVMVMEEMATRRKTHVLIRGEYDKPGEKVTSGVPAALAPVAHAPGSPAPTNRLGLAKWIVDPANPLTARVAVNRAWQLHFGTGLVKTTEDFGTQGEFPSHPDLLDWLAVVFQKDWDLKRLHKLIVTSATYRQSSKATAENRDKDPENRLLARFPRLRLSPEMVRDQALFASGLLVEKRGGPSVKPYQPPGLWKELTGTEEYVRDTGEGLYRRSLYTYWKRTAPPPVLATFDAAGRETCWVRESRTNTPLQALALLNETGFVEAARVLAERVMSEARSPDERLTIAFRRVLARSPSDAELSILRDALHHHRAKFCDNPAAAKKLLAIGDKKADPKLDPAELEAYATICGTILNLDEAVTKE